MNRTTHVAEAPLHYEKRTTTNDLPPGYKRTEMGVIPEDWEVENLGKIVDITSGESPSKLQFGFQGIPYFKVEQLNNADKYIGKKQTQYFISNDNKYILKNSLVFPKRGASILLNKVRILISNSYIDTNLMALTPKRNLFYEFLFYLLNFKHLSSLADTTSIPQINNKHINTFLIPLPPLHEQHAIATALSDVDALITALEKLIAKKRAIKTAAMQQLLTGKTRLPGFSGEWETKRLGGLLKVRHGKDQKNIINKDGKYPILATSGEIGRTNKSLYDKPSVLIGRKGTIDKPLYPDKPFWTIDTLFYTEIEENVVPKFIFYVFNLIDWYAYNEASGVPSLNASTIENIEIKVPCFKEQTAIAQVLSDMDAEIDALEKRLEKTRAIKEGMMQALLTGRIRLINQGGNRA